MEFSAYNNSLDFTVSNAYMHAVRCKSVVYSSDIFWLIYYYEAENVASISLSTIVMAILCKNDVFKEEPKIAPPNKKYVNKQRWQGSIKSGTQWDYKTLLFVL